MTPLSCRARSVLLLSVVVFALLAAGALFVPTHAFESHAAPQPGQSRRQWPAWRVPTHDGPRRNVEGYSPRNVDRVRRLPARPRPLVDLDRGLAGRACRRDIVQVRDRPTTARGSLDGVPERTRHRRRRLLRRRDLLAAPLPPEARRAVRVLAMVCIVLVGVARVALRAHWPTDAAAGIALGLALASAACMLTGGRARAGPPVPYTD